MMPRVGLLADVHGSPLALEAVLGDMRAQGVTDIIFLGDTHGEMGFALETVRLLRATIGLCAVRGNRERYLVSLAREDQADWTHEQFAPLYYAYRTLGEENRAWLTGLPDVLRVDHPGLPPIFAAHEADRHFGASAVDRVECEWYRDIYRPSGVLDAAYYARKVQARVLADAPTATMLSELPAGVYTFGHTHIQWGMQIGDVTLVNPGSCGLPLDLRADAPYTLLTGEAGRWTVEARRVPYDTELAARMLTESPLYREAKVLSRVTLAQLRTAQGVMQPFFSHAARVAREWNRSERFPFDNDVWREAGRRWFEAEA